MQRHRRYRKYNQNIHRPHKRICSMPLHKVEYVIVVAPNGVRYRVPADSVKRED